MSERPAQVETLLAGRYALVRQLGRGAFGHTFLARDRDGARDVAVKRLDPRGDADFWKSRELFEREATVLRSLRHHGIPEIYDVVRDTWEGVPAVFLVMEYIDGVSLAQVIDEQRQMDPAEVLHLLLELLGILDYLHGRVPPVLHRDIKPSNIVVRPDGRPALVDFGSVRRVAAAPDEEGSTVAGTYGYMPYEQYMGQATPASDLYALGATFLHLVTGRAPREFMDDEGRLDIPSPLPGDARLAWVVAKLLRASPAERFASARAVRHALLAPPDAGALARPPVPALVRPVTLARGSADAVLELATPRPLDGPTAALLDRVSWSAWDLMDSSNKPGTPPGVLDWLGLAFFSTITLGAVPVVFFGMARARRRRMTDFLRDGIPAVGRVIRVELEPTAFGDRIASVSYEFEVDGALHRDVDRVLPSIALRWQPGDQLRLLYLPDRDYDSVIISA